MLCLFTCWWVGKCFHTMRHVFIQEAELLIGNFCLFCIVINRQNILTGEEAVMLTQLLYF